MKKLLSIVMAVAMMTVMVCSMSGLGVFAAEATSLLPANASDFTCVDGGDGSVSVTQEGGVFTFTATGGWPQAYYAGADQNAWAKAYVNQEDCYLNWDFEVVSGSANVIVFFCGQNPMDQAGAGVGETINYLIDPANNNLASGATLDLVAGKYKGSIHVKDLGCREDLILSEGGDVTADPNAYFTVSGIKVFAVGGVVVVNDLSVGPKTGDAVTTAPTTTTTAVPAPTPVSTEEQLGDLVVTMTANKDTYAADEVIAVQLTAENVGNLPVENVRLDSLVPDGYEIKSSTITPDYGTTLNPGETMTLVVNLAPAAPTTTTAAPTTTTVAPTTNGPKQDSPKTGDTTNALLATLIAAAAAAMAVAAYKTRGGKQMLSIALCLMLSFSMVAAVPAMTNAEEANSVTLELTVKAGDANVVLKGTAAYGADNNGTTAATQLTTTTTATTTTTKAPLVFTVELPQFPAEVKTHNYAGTHTATCSVTNVTYEVDASGMLNLYFDATTTFNSKGDDKAVSCKISYEIYDSQNALVASGKHATPALKVGENCEAHQAITTLAPVHGEAYRVVLLDA